MITATEQQILALLERKQEIANRVMQTNRMESDHAWLVDAVELLLRHQLELRTELRNAGILQ